MSSTERSKRLRESISPPPATQKRPKTCSCALETHVDQSGIRVTRVPSLQPTKVGYRQVHTPLTPGPDFDPCDPNQPPAQWIFNRMNELRIESGLYDVNEKLRTMAMDDEGYPKLKHLDPYLLYYWEYINSSGSSSADAADAAAAAAAKAAGASPVDFGNTSTPPSSTGSSPENSVQPDSKSSKPSNSIPLSKHTSPTQHTPPESRGRSDVIVGSSKRSKS